jgi:hypothetical protein
MEEDEIVGLDKSTERFFRAWQETIPAFMVKLNYVRWYIPPDIEMQFEYKDKKVTVICGEASNMRRLDRGQYLRFSKTKMRTKPYVCVYDLIEKLGIPLT